MGHNLCPVRGLSPTCATLFVCCAQSHPVVITPTSQPRFDITTYHIHYTAQLKLPTLHLMTVRSTSRDGLKFGSNRDICDNFTIMLRRFQTATGTMHVSMHVSVAACVCLHCSKCIRCKHALLLLVSITCARSCITESPAEARKYVR
jgi:hypothetical protein